MGGIGMYEVILIGLLSLIYLAIPAAALILVILIYSKVKKIEQLVERKE